MSEIILLIFVVFVVILFRRLIENDPEIVQLKETIEHIKQTEFEMEHIDGLYYLWAVHEHEGHHFVGQSHDKDELTQRGVDFLKRKYAIS